MNILITGASGFIGSALFERLSVADENNTIVGVSRTRCGNKFVQFDFEKDNDWESILEGVDVVIHCAALSSSTGVSTDAEKARLHRVNVEASINLAEQARDRGVSRFIFLSSIKALGESTEPGSSYTNSSDYHPEDIYGETKRDAELGIQSTLQDSNTDCVIIRPPLVYGPGVGGNFELLMKIARKSMPLPFASLDNKRSFVALDNLADFVQACVALPGNLNGVFLVSDDEDVSSKRLLQTLTLAYGGKPRFWPFPISLLHMMLRTVGKGAIGDRLFKNLQVDISESKRALGWEPIVTFDEAVRDCVRHGKKASRKIEKQ